MFTKLRWQWSIVRHRKMQFLRWAWLRLTGRTAYRFAPLHITARTMEGTIEQANGWCVLAGWKTPETCDWRAALSEAMDRLEAEAKVAKRKTRPGKTRSN